jgi:hypothetical protein
VRPGQHQQNRRGRGRNNNNGGGGGGNHQRKGQNPLSRSFESNGPDVKVRGTPAHIAEKYLALARDAQSAGDRVLAENYLQHAEHYNRIIMAYREQFQTPAEQGQPQRRVPGSEGLEGDELGDDDGQDTAQDDFGGGPQPGMAHGNTPQPGSETGNQPPIRPQQQHREHQRHDPRPEGRQEGRYDRQQGQNDRYGEGQHRGDRPFRRDGQQQNRFRDRNDRNFRPHNNNPQGDRPYEQRYDRGDRPQHRPDQQRGDVPRQDFRQDRGPRADRQERFERHDHSESAERPVMPTEPVRQVPAEPAPFVPAPMNVAPPPLASDAHPVPTPAAPSRRRERLADQPSEQPEFLKRPVRRTRATAAVSDAAVEPSKTAAPAALSGDEPSSTD